MKKIILSVAALMIAGQASARSIQLPEPTILGNAAVSGRLVSVSHMELVAPQNQGFMQRTYATVQFAIGCANQFAFAPNVVRIDDEGKAHIVIIGVEQTTRESMVVRCKRASLVNVQVGLEGYYGMDDIVIEDLNINGEGAKPF